MKKWQNPELLELNTNLTKATINGGTNDGSFVENPLGHTMIGTSGPGSEKLPDDYKVLGDV